MCRFRLLRSNFRIGDLARENNPAHPVHPVSHFSWGDEMNGIDGMASVWTRAARGLPV